MRHTTRLCSLLPSGILSLTLFIAFLLTPVAASAQERAGDILKQLEMKEVAPPEEPSEPPVIEREDRPEAVSDEGVTVTVGRFEVEGATLIAPETIEAIIGPYEGRELTLGEIVAVADAITDAYRRSGYIIAYAYVPAQDIEDGTVVIRVLEGALGKVMVSGNEYYTSDFIKGHIEEVGRDPSLRVDALERALLILNEQPSLRVRTFLRAGKRYGTSDIIAVVEDSRHLRSGITYDNFGSRTVSRHRASLWLEAGSLVEDGDLLRLAGTTGLDRLDLQRLAYVRAEYSMPFDYRGTRVGLYYTNSVYEAGEHLAPLEIEGRANVVGVWLTHPVIKRPDETLVLRAGFDHKNVYDYMLDSLRSKDNIRAASLGMSWDLLDRFFGRSAVSVAWYQGLSGFMGGAGSDEPGTSRLGADGGFSRFTVDLARTQPIADRGLLVLMARGQLSGDALFSAEQFSIGGVGSVRGFKPTLFSGDSGYATSVELHISGLVPGTAFFREPTVVLFADHGGVYRNDLQPGESRDDYLTSVGAGLRLLAGGRMSVRADWAVPRREGDFSADKAMIHVQAQMSF